MKPRKPTPARRAALRLTLLISLLLSACLPQTSPPPAAPIAAATPNAPQPTPSPAFTERPVYAPGELVEYTAQTGDTLPALARRFNTRLDEILAANPGLPADSTTLPPGLALKIPIYYLPFWGTSYQVIPDSLFVNGPAQVGFDVVGYVNGQTGWLKNVVEYAANRNMSGGEVVAYVARQYSVSPRLLLALLELGSGAVTRGDPSPAELTYPLGYARRGREGLYRQLIWAANNLNDGYYRWRSASLLELERSDGQVERFDPWQNAATVALHALFNQMMSPAQRLQAAGPDGLGRVYRQLFGDPWTAAPHIPGGLQQPELRLPFDPGQVWAFTGGPHTAWGTAEPLAALDFAPPAMAGGCTQTDLWATAVARGIVVRSEDGELVLDLDGDLDERTGWVIFYLHLAEDGRPAVGTPMLPGDRVGHPSCEGGSSTGTHVHIARKYNGEWLQAEGVLAFNLGGWIAHYGAEPYLGTLTRPGRKVTACVCSNAASFISADEP